MPIAIGAMLAALAASAAKGAAARGGSRAVDAVLGTPVGQGAQAGVLGVGPKLASGFLSDLVSKNDQEPETPLTPTGITQPTPIQAPQDANAAIQQLLELYFSSQSGGFQ